jgi:putative MATE family efflux protein
LRATDRRIVRLAIPALGSLAVEPLYLLVDTAIVGRLGTAQLGGLALAGTELGFVVAGCNFLTYGTTERVARRLGAGRTADAADVGVQATWLAVIIGVVVAPLVALTAPAVAGALGGSGAVLDHAISYLRIAAVGIPFVVFALAAQGVQRGGADYRTPLVILLLSNAVNTVLEVLFVFGFDWGIPGSAWSTVIAQVAAGVAFALVIRRHLVPARHRRPHAGAMAPLLTAGKHLLLRVGSMMVVISGATAVAARTDEPTLAAHQIGASLLLFLSLALDALAIPAQTLVADELGRHSLSGAAELSRRASWLSVVVAGVLAVVLAAVAPVLPHAFSADAAVIERATSIVWWLAVMLVPAAIAFAYDGVLIGAADYRFLGLAALGYLAAMIPVAAVVLAAQWGVAGIWGGLTAWMVLRAAVNHARQRRVLSAAAFDIGVPGELGKSRVRG